MLRQLTSCGCWRPRSTIQSLRMAGWSGQQEQPTLFAHGDAHGQSNLTPTRVVTFTNEEATFDNQGIQKVLQDSNAKDDQVFIVSITGVCRSGKSFLINMMTNYLDYYCKNGSGDGWEKSESPVTGIKWAKGRNQSVTQGIWMIVYPKLVGKKRIVFLDCQGTGDNSQSTLNLDNMIMFYALKLSDLTILNARSNVTSRDLDSMGVCVLSQNEQRVAAGFQDLVIVVRDWDEEDETPPSLDTLVKETNSADVRQSAEAVIEACKSVVSVGLSSPGKKITRGSETDNLTVKDMDKDFIKDCKQLFEKFLIERPAKSTMQSASGFDFGHKFQVLGADTVGRVQSQMEMCLSARVSEAYEEAQNTLENEVNMILGNNMMKKVKSQVRAYLSSVMDVVYDNDSDSSEMKLQRKFESKVKKLKEEAEKTVEKATHQYLSNEWVVQHASEERKREDTKRLKDLVHSAIERAESQLRMQKAEEELRNENRAYAKGTSVHAKMQERKELERIRLEKDEVERQLEELKKMRLESAARYAKEKEKKEKEVPVERKAEEESHKGKQTARDQIAQAKFDKNTRSNWTCTLL